LVLLLHALQLLLLLPVRLLSLLLLPGQVAAALTQGWCPWFWCPKSLQAGPPELACMEF
jgi:hypothetical protein